MTGCRMGPNTYEVFEDNKNSLVKLQPSMDVFSGYDRTDFNETMYIYIRNTHERAIDTRCQYGFRTKKNDPDQRPLDWIIISGKEYCKQQQLWTCCI